MTASQGYVSIARRSLDVEDYIDILRRHVAWIVGPLFAGLVISCVVAFFLPNQYVSTAQLRIAPAQIPANLMESTISQQLIDRITQMQQDILSRTSLSEMIHKFGLYKRELDTKPLEDVLEQMHQKDIQIKIAGLPGQQAKMATAFSVSFAYPDRLMAQKVVGEIVSKFTESNVTMQKRQTGSTLEFMTGEVAQAKGAMDRLDQELTTFRVANQGRLPEQLQINVQAMSALQQQLGAITQALNQNQQDKMMLETSIQTMQSQYQNLLASAPAMEETNQTVKNERLINLNHRISENEAQLNALRQEYTEKHPDVISMNAQLESLKRERDVLQKQDEQDNSKAKNVPKKTSPALTRTLADMQAQVDHVKALVRAKDVERVSRLKEQEQLQRNIAAYQGRIEASPANEQKYVALQQEHTMAAQHYQELLKKAELADTSKRMSEKNVGEQLEVLDPASLPETPTAPNRWLIVGVGVGLGLMVGVCLAAAKEMKDTSLKNLKDVRAYTNMPILSSIPLLENALLVRRKRRLAYLGWSTAVIVGIVAMSASMYYHYFFRA